jgi:hypothetical protein
MPSSLGIALSGIQNSQFDPDSIAFLSAAEITDATQKYAINNLVVGLKTYGLWSKMQAIYPFVGGTSTTHKWNLKDPRDLDNAFRIVFNGGWTHSSTGAQGNGVNGYANTGYTPAGSGLTDSAHLCYYSRFGPSADGVLIGCGGGGASLPRQYMGKGISFTALNSSGEVTYSPTTFVGMNTIVRSNSSEIKTYEEGSLKQTLSLTSYNSPAIEQVFLNARSTVYTGVTAQSFTDSECAFASIGSSLNDTNVSNLYTVVQAYQTTLSRQV